MKELIFGDIWIGLERGLKFCKKCNRVKFLYLINIF